MKYNSQRTMTESPGKGGATSFDDYMALKHLMIEDSDKLPKGHIFKGFDLKSHNANAE